MKIIMKWTIYNSVTKVIGIGVQRLIRKIRRPNWMYNGNDPYYLMSQWTKYGKYNPELVNKYEVKNILKDIIDAPKNIFTFDRNGNVTSGEIPKSGKIVIKHSNGSNFVRIVEASMVNSKMLKKLYRKWELFGENYGIFLEEHQYAKASNICFGEEYIPGEPDDYKIHYFDKNEYTFLIVRNRGKTKYPYLEWNKNFEPMIDDTKMKMAPIMKQDDKRKYKILLKLCEKISKKIGRHYFRGDFYFIDDKPYLGEITLTNSAGKVYEGKNNYQTKIKKQNEYFVNNYKRVNNMK